jgi:ribonuclease HI
MKYIPDIWTLYFDGSRSQEGVGSGCLFINVKGKHNFLSCRLEFHCKNNTTEYEALVQGLNDLGRHQWSPTYSTSSKYSFHLGSFSMVFWVPNFWGCFEALNDDVLARTHIV